MVIGDAAVTERQIQEPLHTAEIRGQRLRFFRAPSGNPELPWHAIDDLFLVCGFNREMRRHFLRSAQTIFGDDLRTVATSTGPTTIAPHCAAQALLGAASDVGFLSGIEEAYTLAASKALEAMAGDLPPVAKFEYLMTAARNSGIGGDA